MASGRYTGYTDDRYPLEGFYVRRPEFMRLVGPLSRFIAASLEADGYEPVLLPTLIPEHVIAAEVDHIGGFEPAVYWVTEKGRGEPLPEKLALAISSETIFAGMFREWISDGTSLPLRCYQQRTVFRAESRGVTPLLREREFPWFEAHTAFEDEDSCQARIEADSQIVARVAAKLGVPVTRKLRGKEDKCPGAIHTYGFDIPTADGGVNQIASTHYLGQRFARVFDLRAPGGGFAHQTSFGIGLSRLVAAIVDHNPGFEVISDG